MNPLAYQLSDFSYLEDNVPDPAIAFEELLHVPVSGIFRDVSEIDFVISRHGWFVIAGNRKNVKSRSKSHKAREVFGTLPAGEN